MVFTSLEFLIFLVVCVAAYFAVPVRGRGYVLLAASLVFYACAGLEFFPFILGAMAVSFLCARGIGALYERRDAQLEGLEREEKSKLKEETRARAKRLMLIALVVLVGTLCYTKFFDYILELISSTFGAGQLSAVTVIIPLGISYYTFATVGYVLDIYWERYKPEPSFLKYATYVCYFPHILQGPIPRYDRLGVQLFQEHRFDYKRVCFGAQLIIWGFFEKLVIADRLGIFVSNTYDAYDDVNGAIFIVATLFYAVQIYTDFRGCVDIARGISQIFDITLEDNFRQPYFSQSVAEYWRRWHITLGAWFKDYLCMPVAVAGWTKKVSKFCRTKWGRNAGKNAVTICSLIAVWLCTGIWHGTGVNYILWAVWQGGIIALSTVLEPNYRKWKDSLKIDDNANYWHLFRILRTFVVCAIIPRVITRAPSLYAAAKIFKRMVFNVKPALWFNGALFTYGLSKADFFFALLCILILFVVGLLKEGGVQIRESVAAWPLPLRWAFYLAALFSVIIFGIYGVGFDASSFAYMGF